MEEKKKHIIKIEYSGTPPSEEKMQAMKDDFMAAMVKKFGKSFEENFEVEYSYLGPIVDNP